MAASSPERTPQMPNSLLGAFPARIFIAGCLAILFQFALGAAILALAPSPAFIAAAFLMGVILGAVIARAAPALAFPAMGLLALTGVGPAFIVDAPLFGRIVNLRQVDDIPAGLSIAGYIAPGWRIDETRARKERLTAGRPSREYGHRVVAPLVGDGWTPEHPVEVWVAGEIRNSGLVRPSHPKFWSAPGGEFVRFVGFGVSGAQLQASRAAAEHGLRTSEEPLIVTRAPSVAEAIETQYRRLAWALRWPFGAWLVMVCAVTAGNRLRARRGAPAAN